MAGTKAKTLVEIALAAGILLASAGCAKDSGRSELRRRVITIETSEEIKGVEIIGVYRDGCLIRETKRYINKNKEPIQKQEPPQHYYNPQPAIVYDRA